MSDTEVQAVVEWCNDCALIGCPVSKGEDIAENCPLIKQNLERNLEQTVYTYTN